MRQKLILSLTTLILMVHVCSSQQLNVMEPSHYIDSELLKTAKRQKTFGWIMIGVGVSVIGVYTWGSYLTSKKYVGEWVLGTLSVIGGVVLVTTGIKNKKRALSVGFNTTKISLPSLANMNYQLQPSLVVSIPF